MKYCFEFKTRIFFTFYCFELKIRALLQFVVLFFILWKFLKRHFNLRKSDIVKRTTFYGKWNVFTCKTFLENPSLKVGCVVN